MGLREAARWTVRGLSAFVWLGLGGCSDTEPDEPAGSRWSLVFFELDAALISVTGSAADDVWTVGANDGSGPLVLHFDGAGWTRAPIAAAADLWWVHIAAPDTIVCAGSDGTIVRGNREAGFTRDETPGTATVYGVFGTPDELWAVGGDADVSPGFVWRDRGDGWEDVTPEISAEPLPPVFKVWGAAPDDVWFVGMDGLAIHYDGEGFSREESGTTRRLFTVHGTGQGEAAYAAVGGFGSAVIVEHDGSTWRDVTPDNPPNMLFGVSMLDGERGYAVGEDGVVVARSARGWADETTGFDLMNQLHSVWVDPEGGVWAAGGDVVTPALDQGMLLFGDPSGARAAIPNRIDE